MKLMEKLFNGRGYIDGITIINLTGEILFTAKFNNKLMNAPEIEYEVVGKNFLEVYENLSEETSSTYRSMALGVPIYVENQVLKSKDRHEIKITSLSIPIKSGNSIVGAVDISVDETNAEAFRKDMMAIKEIQMADVGSLGMDTNAFENHRVGTLKGHERVARYSLDSIITNNREMRVLKEYVAVAAGCDLPTLIYGETGTGKEVFAHAIHQVSERRNRPFISQNCAAIPENLLESILFGTARGAFTGAVDNVGLFEMADGGTLLLDEINSMPLHLQSKLLRVLEERTVRSVGSRKEIGVDIKIIAATNEEPLKCIEKGILRRDIYYRLSALNMNIPPLRQRKDDIPLLVNHMVLKHNKTFGKQVKYVCQNLLEELSRYHWPGNIRELENIIIHGISMAGPTQERLNYQDIAMKMEELRFYDGQAAEAAMAIKPLNEMVQDYEKTAIHQVLRKTDYNVSKAAKLLSVPRQTLQRKSKQYDLI